MCVNFAARWRSCSTRWLRRAPGSETRKQVKTPSPKNLKLNQMVEAIARLRDVEADEGIWTMDKLVSPRGIHSKYPKQTQGLLRKPQL